MIPPTIPPSFDNYMFNLNLIAASTSDYGRGVNRGRRERITYTRKQLEILEDMFRQTHYPDVFKRENLSALLGIPEGRIQVWFKNRRARFRQSNRNPFLSNNSSLDGEELKVSKTELPEIHHRSPQPASSSNSSSSDSPSATSIGVPKVETYDDLKQLHHNHHQPHHHHHHQQPHQQQFSFNPTGFDNLKDFYSMQIPMNGNFWQTPNWQNPSSYYSVPYPTSYPSMPTTNSATSAAAAAATFYGYPQAAAAMQQSYQNFYPSYPVGNPGYPQKDNVEEADLMNPSNFSPYAAAFTHHQPGTSTAAMASAAAAAAATQNSFAALSFEAAAANTLMHGAMRTPNPYRPEIPRSTKRERTKFDAFQLEQMEHFFKTKPYPDGNDREEMAKNLNLTDVKVQIWFKNRRAKDRNQKHLDELMAKSRGDFAASKSSSATMAGRSTGEVPPIKKKRRTESPLPDPMLQQQQQLLRQQQQQQLQLQSSHESKDSLGSGEIKQEITDGVGGVVDYSNGIYDTSLTWDDRKDMKTFYQSGNYAAFGFPDPTATFQTSNTNWMTQSYSPYSFPCFPQASACYYPTTNGVTPAAAAYNGFYATQYASIPNFKDSKVELPSTESPINNINNNSISPTTIFKPNEIEQPYAKFT